MARTMTGKIARRVLRYARALPILKPRMRAKVARAAREWLAGGYSPTTNDLLVPVDWAEVHRALAKLAVADMPGAVWAKQGAVYQTRVA